VQPQQQVTDIVAKTAIKISEVPPAAAPVAMASLVV